MGAPACGACNTTAPREMTAVKQKSSRTSAARSPWLRTRSDAPERDSRRARSARCGAGTRSEQRRRAQQNPSGGCSRPARAGASREFTAWRSTQLLPTRAPRNPTGAHPAHSMASQCSPKEAATLAHVRSVPRKRAAARATWRDTRGADRKPYDSRREHRAPEAFQHGAATRKAFAEPHVGGCTMQRSRGGEALRTHRATL
jgi:hypothetical protein